MESTPVHVHVFRLIKHITTTPVSFVVPVTERRKKALIGRQRKMARRKRRTQQLLSNVHKGLLAPDES
jgi:hypothetical protein